MPDGRTHESTNRSSDPEKRLAQYKNVVEKALNQHGDSKQRFIKHLAQFILAEVRNERKLIEEFRDELKNVYLEFIIDTD